MTRIYHTRNKSAFTLIELLVVIAIIAILAAILFPVFAQAKEAAKKANCISNLKNITMAVTLYTTDFDDRYMNSGSIYWFGRSVSGVWNQELGQLWPYLKNGPITDCPSARDIPQQSNITAPYAYGINASINTSAGVFASDIQLPAETICFEDAGDIDQIKADKPLSKVYGVGLLGGWAHGRHAGDSVAVGWLDGHVKAQKVDTRKFDLDFGGGFIWTAAKMQQYKLGDVLKFPRSWTANVNNANINTYFNSKDHYYLVLNKRPLQ